jgi:ubiquinone/menaquinone biosynthesis C-methylase UbiE
MELQDAINLVKDESINQQTPAVWADFGAGSGLFSFALANILAEGSIIYAVDASENKLDSLPNPKNIEIRQVQLEFIREEIRLEKLDGILMANSLHYVDNKLVIIQKLSKCMKEEGMFIIVEYDTDMPNGSVPYPAKFETIKQFFGGADYYQARKLNEIPSKLNDAPIYSAIFSR